MRVYLEPILLISQFSAWYLPMGSDFFPLVRVFGPSPRLNQGDQFIVVEAQVFGKAPGTERPFVRGRLRHASRFPVIGTAQ